MFDRYSQTPEQIAQKNTSDHVAAVQLQTQHLLEILQTIGKAIMENKSVNVENTLRQVVGEVSVKHPDWIKELKQDLTPLEKKLDYIAASIIRKDGQSKIVQCLEEIDKIKDERSGKWNNEVVEAVNNIKFPEAKEAEKLIPILREVLQAIQAQEFPSEVSIKEPTWYKPLDLDKYVLSMGKFLKGLQEKIFRVNVENEVTIANPVKEVTILNPVERMTVDGIDKVVENTKLMTAQLRALGTTGGGGGANVTALATEKTLQTLSTNTSLPSSIDSNQKTVTTAGTQVQFPTNTCKSITIKALKTNTGSIYVGGSGVSSSTGFTIAASETMSLDITNTNAIWINSSVNGEGVSYFFVN